MGLTASGLELPLYPEEVLYLAVRDLQVHIGTKREKEARDNLLFLCDTKEVSEMAIVVVDRNQDWAAMMDDLKRLIERYLSNSSINYLCRIGEGSGWFTGAPAPLCFMEKGS